MPLIKVKEVQKRLNNSVALSTIYSLLRQGKLRGTRFGGVVLVESESVDEMIEQGKVALIAKPALRRRATA